MNGRVARLVLGALTAGVLTISAAARADAQEAFLQGAIQPFADVLAVARQPIDMRVAKVFGVNYSQPVLADPCGVDGCDVDCGDPACTECGLAGCGPCCPCGPAGRFWIRADYLMWWTRGQDVPPLVTTTTSPNGNGILGEEGTIVLFGGRRYNDYPRHNLRVQFGYWMGECRIWGVQADYFNLGQNATNYANSSNGDPLLARPIYDVINEQEGVEIISRENIATGEVESRVTDDFQSAGVALRRNLCCHFDCCEMPVGCGEQCAEDCGELGCEVGGESTCGLVPGCWRVDLIGGYRHYNLRDSVGLDERVVLTQDQGGGATPAGTIFEVSDSFRSQNEFHGGEIGLIAERHRGRWSLQALAKVALGNNHKTVDIDGSTSITLPGFDPETYTGGLLALENTNIGTYHRDEFVVIPQFGLELGYQLTCCTRVFVGYDFLLWTDVARAGDHISRRVNRYYMPPQDNPPGPAEPAFAWQGSDFWAQGVNLGLEMRR